MSEMVERVAKALFVAEQPEGAPWNEFRWTHTAANYRLLARAALEAMREPTQAIGTAAYAAWDAFGEDAIMGPEEAVAMWRAMIDAALAAPTNCPVPAD